jgi:2-polyprenyl-3-methyl-5-hydroxy-6-metoxy-1,4-benzoquinol methylase
MKLKSHKNTDGTRLVEDSETYNLTHLSPFKEFARGRLIHRDFNAHVFRWSHAAMMLFKRPNRETSAVLDIACGPDWPLLTTLHSNGSAPAYFLGVDARDCTKTIPVLSKTTVEFQQHDITKTLPAAPATVTVQTVLSENPRQIGTHDEPKGEWDMIVCFEVLEHMPKESGLKLLDKIKEITSPNTLILFSTPVFDENVGMADNHLYEWGYEELKGELESRFTLENHYGTFASLRDYTPLMTPQELNLLAKLKEYYNSAMVSCLMAPLYPHKARNVLWQLKYKA